MKKVGTQTIETERLILRRFTVEDAGDMYKNWASDPEVTKYLTWPPHESVEFTKSLLADWVKRGGFSLGYHMEREWRSDWRYFRRSSG